MDVFGNSIVSADWLELVNIDSVDTVMDTLTQLALEVLFNGKLIVLERQCKDQLPLGKYHEISDVLCKSSKHVPTTNIVSERDMAILDLILKLKPAASILSVEAIVLWLNNKPSKWLDSLTDEMKNKVLDEARENADSIYAKFKEREQAVKDKKMEVWKQKRDEKMKKEEKARKAKVAASNKICEFGGVWTLKSFKRNVKKYSVAGKLKAAVLAQLKFHDVVLKSNGRRELFCVTKKGKAYTLSELESHLKEVLEMNQMNESDEYENVAEDADAINEIQYNIDDIKDTVEKQKIDLQKKRDDAKRKLSNTTTK